MKKQKKKKKQTKKKEIKDQNNFNLALISVMEKLRRQDVDMAQFPVRQIDDDADSDLPLPPHVAALGNVAFLSICQIIKFSWKNTVPIVETSQQYKFYEI